MKKLFTVAALVLFAVSRSYSQLYMTRAGFAGFYSKTSLEDIIAENNQVYAVIDLGKKNIAFSALLRGFIFRKELMQEHFNENYIESDKYPKTTFTGSYPEDVPVNGNGVFQIRVKGNLTLHNVTKEIEEPATIEVKDGRLYGKSEFNLKPGDFNIKIPSVVRDKIAREIHVVINIDCSTVK